MNIQVETSKLLKPIAQPNLSKTRIHLSVFDSISEDAHIPIIYVYRTPTPSNAALELGLREVLSCYREVGGRLGTDDKGKRVILLNDEGIMFVEAYADCTLDESQLLIKPSEEHLLSFHPCLDSPTALAQVQLTRFTCGSLVVGFSMNHMVCDGFSASQFLVAWGQACRGTMSIATSTLRDRTIFTPRNPPRFEFEHNGIEFRNKNEDCKFSEATEEMIIMHKLHFTLEQLDEIKSKASLDFGTKCSYSMFESLMAYVWRSVARACSSADDGDCYKGTCLRIAVNGRRRMRPAIPDEYFGNVVLWAYPRAGMKEIVSKPIGYAAKIIHETVGNMNEEYFKSFIDFASCRVDEGDLVPKMNFTDSDACLNLNIDSWLKFPFSDMDFGEGKPVMFKPSCRIWGGQIYVVPSYIGDGRIDVYVTLSKNQLSSLKEILHAID
ncbi:hypothetical protein Sjap_013626 [Stephania japonica]|uniref:Uncharacterized protein n=1 Tax=Stephania japonica TaxID=461633 RepID=A0AAP0IY85_9MAGN